MTLQTALDLIRQGDLNHILAFVGRITEVDTRAYRALEQQSRREDVEELWAEVNGEKP